MFLISEPRDASIGVVGRSNLVTSALFNAVIGKKRLLASDFPEMTGGAVDADGTRKRPGANATIGYYSALRSLNTVMRSDIVLLAFDPITGVTPQDRRLAGIAIEEGKGLIFVGNESNIEHGNAEFSRGELANAIHALIPFAHFAPILFLSVRTDRRLSSLLRVVDRVAENLDRRVSTEELTTVLRDAVFAHPAAAASHFGIYHASQVGSHPPVFAFRCNNPEGIQPHDRRFLENVIRKHFDFRGVPLTLEFHSNAKPRGEIAAAGKERAIRSRRR